MPRLNFVLAIVATILFTGSIWANQTSYVNGQGRSSGFCSYTQGIFCIDDVKSASERDAQDNAEWNCRLSKGQPLTYSALCNSTCFPNTLTPNDRNTLVNCSSSCTMQCEIQN